MNSVLKMPKNSQK